MHDPKNVPAPDESDGSADNMMFAYEELTKCQKLVEELLDERDATRAALDTLMHEKEELQRTLDAKNEELLGLRQSGQAVRDKVAKMRIRLEEGSIPH